MSYKTVVFDLDGTLLDTLPDLRDSVNHALAAGGFPERSYDEIKSFVGNGIASLVRLALPENSGEETFEKTYAAFRAHYGGNLANLTAPYRGIPELLASLARAGKKICVVSNKFDSGVRELCGEFFPGLIGAAVGESGTIMKKPAPDSVYKVLEKIGSPAAEAVYVGDSEVDIETAENAGLPFIGVSWGFRGREFLIEKGAETVVDSPLELLSLLI